MRQMKGQAGAEKRTAEAGERAGVGGGNRGWGNERVGR